MVEGTPTGSNQPGGYGGYGKRPLWQWIVLYIVIGGLVYFAIYYFFFRSSNLYGTNRPATSPAASVSSSTAASGPIISTKTDPKLGDYLVDASGNALYTNSTDSPGVSNCSGSCAAAWPAYTATVSTDLPTNVTVITRADGSQQYAYKGMPLYRFSGDTAPGQVTGDGVNNFHVAKP